MSQIGPIIPFNPNYRLPKAKANVFLDSGSFAYYYSI